jgi:8-oxo-dGTP pyrophosphatase MutT (NUDIX family)
MAGQRLQGDDDAAQQRLNLEREPTPAAVLVPVFRDEAGELRIVLVVRGERGVHGGQLGLPGGKWEPGDASLLETALREAEEEIGLVASDVEIVAELSPLDTHVSGFRVHPYLARIRPPARWRLAPGEIADVVTPLVAGLADRAARQEQLLSQPSWPEPLRVEGIAIEPSHLLWGLTLRLLDGVVPRLLAEEWPI